MAGNNIFPTTVEVLTKALSFAEERHRIIANNIANANTPRYKAQRAPVAEFQKALAQAIELSRRAPMGEFRMRPTRHVAQGRFGLDVKAIEDAVRGAGILRHDENNVSIEKEMAALAENTLRYRIMSDLLRKQFLMLRMAVGERVG